jgi:hypothetical protein
MSGENDDHDIRAVWQSQATGARQPGVEEIRMKWRERERRMRRNRIDGFVALGLSAVAIVTIAVWFANSLLIAGAVLTVAGFTFLAFEVTRHHRRRPAADDGAAPSLGYELALLAHQLEFHRKRLWWRVMSLAPGGMLFFTGFAVARPDLAPFIYVELATFVVALMAIVPVNRRAAVKLQREIAALQALGSGNSHD